MAGATGGTANGMVITVNGATGMVNGTVIGRPMAIGYPNNLPHISMRRRLFTIHHIHPPEST